MLLSRHSLEIRDWEAWQNLFFIFLELLVNQFVFFYFLIGNQFVFFFFFFDPQSVCV